MGGRRRQGKSRDNRLAVAGNWNRHHSHPHQQHLILRPAESLVEPEVDHLGNLNLRPLTRGSLRRNVQIHRQEFLDLVNLAFERGVDPAAVKRQERTQLERKPFVDQSGFRLEARPGIRSNRQHSWRNSVPAWQRLPWIGRCLPADSRRCVRENRPDVADRTAETPPLLSPTPTPERRASAPAPAT